MQTVPEAPIAIRTNLGAIFISLELSRSRWLITSLAPAGGEKMSKHVVRGGDVAGLLERFVQLREKTRARTGKVFPFVVIQEAGLDGFWIDRALQNEGIESHVVDPASIATSRRRRRAKSETLKDALAHHGKPDIFNTDQGSQFTGAAFTSALASNGITISMDGKGAWRDNVFVERLWRSVKYEEVYLRAYDSVSEARASIGRYLDFYNGRRPHSSLHGTTPDQAYFTQLPVRLAA